MLCGLMIVGWLVNSLNHVIHTNVVFIISYVLSFSLCACRPDREGDEEAVQHPWWEGNQALEPVYEQHLWASQQTWQHNPRRRPLPRTGRDLSSFIWKSHFVRTVSTLLDTEFIFPGDSKAPVGLKKVYLTKLTHRCPNMACYVDCYYSWAQWNIHMFQSPLSDNFPIFVFSASQAF